MEYFMKLIYFCCLLVFYSKAFAEWREITKDDEKIYFVESNFIVPHLNDRRMAKNSMNFVIFLRTE